MAKIEIEMIPIKEECFKYWRTNEWTCTVASTQIMNYLDPRKIYQYVSNLYYNYEVFDSELYGDQSIIRASKISEIAFPSRHKQIDFDI